MTNCYYCKPDPCVCRFINTELTQVAKPIVGISDWLPQLKAAYSSSISGWDSGRLLELETSSLPSYWLPKKSPQYSTFAAMKAWSGVVSDRLKKLEELRDNAIIASVPYELIGVDLPDWEAYEDGSE